MSPLQHILYIYLNLFQNWRFWTTHITQLFLFEIHCSWVGMHFEGNARIALWCSLLYSCFCLCLCRSTVAVLLDSHAHSKSPSITKALIPQLWSMIHWQSSTQHLPYSLFEIHSFRATSVWCILRKTWRLNVPLLCICMRPVWVWLGFHEESRVLCLFVGCANVGPVWNWLHLIFRLARCGSVLWGMCVWMLRCFLRDREFITRNYTDLKALNPTLPILIRECSGVQPRLWARYGEYFSTLSINHHVINLLSYKHHDPK
jgi:hypothetical protein